MTALSGEQLNDLVRKIPNITKHYRGITTRDLHLRPPRMIKGTPQIFIQNTGYLTEGVHWVLFIFEAETTIFFDSFGRDPKDLHLEASAAKSYKTITYNPFQLQSDYSQVCGHYIIFVLYFLSLGESLYQINKFFSSDYRKNDKLVLDFVNKLAKKWRVQI